MSIVGYCTVCRKIKTVRVESRFMKLGGLNAGTCADCDRSTP